MNKCKFELEYTFNTSPKVIYTRLSTAAGLSEWFADDVNVNGNKFTFIWDDSEQVAELLQKKSMNYVRFRWMEDGPDEFFEFRIKQDELTGDLALIITDFAEEEEKNDSIDLWDTQVSELKHTLGL